MGRNRGLTPIPLPSHFLLVGDTVRDVPRGDMLPRRFAMTALVIEKNIGTESTQEFSLVHSAKEVAFINSDIPCAQGFNYAFMGRRRACGDQRGSDRGSVR